MYIQMISVHGLVRGKQIEMGRDADTGGQVRYVIELAKALSECDQVEQVDLFTRRLRDKRVSADYARQIEPLGPNAARAAVLRRRPLCPQERLWPYLDEFVDAIVAFTRREKRIPTVSTPLRRRGLRGERGCGRVRCALRVHGAFLGKPKLEYLLKEGWSHDEANRELAIDHRIATEQSCRPGRPRDHQHAARARQPVPRILPRREPPF